MSVSIADSTQKKHSGTLIPFLFVALTAFLSENLFFAYGGSRGYYAKMIIQIVVGVLAVCVFAVKNSGLKVSPVFLLVVGIILLSSVIYSTSPGVTTGYIFIILFAYFTSRMFSFERFADLFQQVIFYLCIISIVLWALVQFVPASHSIIPKVSLVNASTGSVARYYSFGIANVSANRLDLFYRNTGIFWEPGIFQAYINISILFEFLTINRTHSVRYLRVIILILTLITTFSTTGFFALAILLLFQLLQGYKMSRHKYVNIVLVAVLGAVLLFFLFNNNDVFNKIFGKIFVENRAGSFNSRYGSIIGNLRVFLRYPILGAGFGRNTVIMQQLASDIASGVYLDQTNTFLQYFSAFGIVAGCYFIYGWVRFSRRLSRGFVGACMIFVFMLVVTSGENFLPSAFFNLLLFYGINEQSHIGRGIEKQ